MIVPLLLFRLLRFTVYGKGQGRIFLDGRVEKTDQFFKGRIYVMVTAATGIRHLIHATRLQACLRGHDVECVAKRRPGFGAQVYSGHVTAHTIGK